MAKKRANGEGSIRKRSDGRWVGRYTVGYDENGKVKMKNVLGKTQAEVKEKLKAKLEEIKVLDVSKSDLYTVGEWAALWEIYAKPNMRERTADYYNRYITKHIVPCLGDIKLNKLTGRQIQKMYNDLLDHGRERVSQKEKNPDLSGTCVHGIHVMLHNCLNCAVKERLIVRNPADDVIVPKIDKKELKILPPEQVKAYLKAASVRGVLPLFYLELGNDAWMGRESIIMPGVKIGDGAIIAAYSVVAKNVPAYTVYGGNPARLIKERFDEELKHLLLRYQWWNLAPEHLTDILPLLCDPDLTKLRQFLKTHTA